MLNEWSEYDAYLDMQSEFGKKLMKSVLTDKKGVYKLVGIGRPLVVLTRGLLEKCRENRVPEAQANELCAAFLKIWFSMDDTIPNCTVLSIKKELEKATVSPLCVGIVGEEKRERFTAALAKRYGERVQKDGKVRDGFFGNAWKAKIEYHSNTNNAEKESSTLNQWSFSRVLTEANLQGDLQNEVLVLKKHEGQGSAFGLNFPGTSAENKRRRALAAVVEFLRARRVDEETEAVEINQTVLSNWVRVKKVDNLYEAEYKGKKLFSKFKMANSMIVVKLNRAWLEDYDVQLVPAESEQEWKAKGYAIITDQNLMKGK